MILGVEWYWWWCLCSFTVFYLLLQVSKYIDGQPLEEVEMGVYGIYVVLAVAFPIGLLAIFGVSFRPLFKALVKERGF